MIKRVLNYNETCYDDILVEINAKSFTRQDNEVIQNLSEIIKDSGEIGEFELGNLKFIIKNLTTYETNLIKIKN